MSTLWSAVCGVWCRKQSAEMETLETLVCQVRRCVSPRCGSADHPPTQHFISESIRLKYAHVVLPFTFYFSQGELKTGVADELVSSINVRYPILCSVDLAIATPRCQMEAINSCACLSCMTHSWRGILRTGHGPGGDPLRS
jgi:hypothetical protein